MNNEENNGRRRIRIGQADRADEPWLTPPQPRKVSKLRKKLLIAAVAIVLVVLAFYVYILLNPSSALAPKSWRITTYVVK